MTVIIVLLGLILLAMVAPDLLCGLFVVAWFAFVALLVGSVIVGLFVALASMA